MNSKLKILAKLEEIKKHEDMGFQIKFRYQENEFILVPVTKKFIDNRKILTLLARWRKKHEKWFPAIFRVTVRGTKKWLKTGVLDQKDRLLFVIKANGDYIGNIGLFRFDFGNMECEIDNIVRGSDNYPGIMTEAVSKMMKWGREELGIKRYRLTTFADNIRAQRLYKRLGFRNYKLIPMVSKRSKDRTDWIEADKKYSGKIKRYNLYMRTD